MEEVVRAVFETAVDGAVAVAAAAVFVALLPVAVVHILLMEAGRRWWLCMLRRRHPTLRFENRTRFAAAMDSARNQGAATALLAVRGRLRADFLREILQTRLLASDSRPHLRLALDWRLGRYAWRDPDALFDISRHVVEAPATWRGCPVRATDAQECVNALAAKRMSLGHPPWQVTLLQAGERTYILVRAHLALLSADKLALEDFVPLEIAPAMNAVSRRLQTVQKPQAPPLLGEDDELPPPAAKIPEPSELTPTNEEDTSGKWEDKKSDPPLVPPSPPQLVALPALYNNFSIFACNSIQHIKSLDPALNNVPSGDPLRWTVALLVAITQVFLRASGDPGGLRVQFLWAAPGAVLHALNPTTLACAAMTATWRLSIWMAAVAPLLAVREAALLAAGRGGESAVGITAATVLLLAAAVREVCRTVSAAVRAPRAVLQELGAAWAEPLSELQAVSLCGRESVAWSAPVPAQSLHRASARARATASGRPLSVDEMVVAALARALDAYFLLAALPQPAVVPATARELSLREALGPRPHYVASWTCLSLPIGAASDSWEGACEAAAHAATTAHVRTPGLRAAAAAARMAAAALLPSVALRMALNALTRRYAVAITFLREGDPRGKGKVTTNETLQLAECELEEAYVWRPLQANISLSLCVVRGPRGLQLGALADAQLTPAPAFLAVAFERELRRAAGDTPGATTYDPAPTPASPVPMRQATSL